MADEGSIAIKNKLQHKRYSMGGSALDGDWSIIKSHANFTLTVGSGMLSILNGTTNSAEVIIRNMLPITEKALVRFIASMLSTVKPNYCGYYFELVNAAGTAYARWQIADEAAAPTAITTAYGVTGTDGSGNTRATITHPTMASGAWVLFEIIREMDEVTFLTLGANSAAARTAGAVFNRLIPGEEEELFIQIRAITNPTGTVTAATLQIDSIYFEELTMVGVEILRSQGNTLGGQSQPINDGAGAITVDGTGIGVVGNAAGDAAVSGNPVMIGIRASTAVPGDMTADGDVVYSRGDRGGRQIVVVQPSLALSGETDLMFIAPATPAAVALKSINAVACKVTKFRLENHTAAWKYMKLFRATSVVLGTTVADYSIGIPPNNARDTDISLDFALLASGSVYYAITGGYPLNDNTVITLGDVSGVVSYL